MDEPRIYAYILTNLHPGPYRTSARATKLLPLVEDLDVKQKDVIYFYPED